jgi:Ni2+-binding GTPase involved in maturation of urease and hydrogenase
MKMLTVSGPPSSGKTSVILRLIQCLDDWRAGVVKFDCLTSFDQALYEENGVPAIVGYAGKLCPDHFFVTHVQDAYAWGKKRGLDLLITESAGLCNRCSPHIRAVPAVCVVDNLSGVNTPRKLGPMLRFADIVAVTKSDIVSQAEREVFAYNIRQINAKARIFPINGITGQGILPLAYFLKKARELSDFQDMRLRFTTPSSICSYCTGETSIGRHYQLGMTKRMEFDEP